jgi:hypothetical protein
LVVNYYADISGLSSDSYAKMILVFPNIYTSFENGVAGDQDLIEFTPRLILAIIKGHAVA